MPPLLPLHAPTAFSSPPASSLPLLLLLAVASLLHCSPLPASSLPVCHVASSLPLSLLTPAADLSPVLPSTALAASPLMSLPFVHVPSSVPATSLTYMASLSLPSIASFWRIAGLPPLIASFWSIAVLPPSIAPFWRFAVSPQLIAHAPPLLPPLVISLPSGVFIADTDFGCTLASCSRHVASLPLILRLRPSSISLLCLDQDGWYLGPACSGLFPVVHGAAICLPPPPGCSPARSALCGLRCLAMAASDAVALFATRFDFSVDHRRRTGDMASGQGLLLCVLCRTLTLLILLSILLLLWFSSSRLLRHHPASSTRPFRIFVFEPMVFAAA